MSLKLSLFGIFGEHWSMFIGGQFDFYKIKFDKDNAKAFFNIGMTFYP